MKSTETAANNNSRIVLRVILLNVYLLLNSASSKAFTLLNVLPNANYVFIQNDLRLD